MDYNEVLKRLEALRIVVERILKAPYHEATRPDYENFAELYGQVEETVLRFTGESRIQPLKNPPVAFKNLIEAGYLSGGGEFQYVGYMELLKVIGKVRQAASDPHALPAPPSVTGLAQILRRFRECCQYLKSPPGNERDVQDIIWIMLRSQYERVDREDTLPKFGLKSYHPDFGIPDLQTLVEVKFIGEKTDPKAIQEEILADIPAYLMSITGKFLSVIEIIYDNAHKLRDPRNFIEDLRKVDGIVEVIVVPGIGAKV